MLLNSRFYAEAKGEIKYTYKVLKSIAALATKEVEGVFLFNSKAISIKIALKSLFIDIKIGVSNLVSCTSVAFLVQENVKKAFENMTSFKVARINVSIVEVLIDNKPQAEKKENE